MQALQGSLKTLSDAHVTATVSSLRALCNEAAGAQGTTVAPPLDPSMRNGRYDVVMGLQQDRYKTIGPPKGESTRPKMAITKTKVTVLPKIKRK